MNGLSFGSGCGAMDLALQSCGIRTIAYCEVDPYAQAVLLARMGDGWLDRAPIWPDARTFDGMAWRGRVDCLYSGIPCQPFSAAGKREGAADDRNLWPFVFRQIAAVRPRRVFIENVANAARYFWSDVLPDLQGLGYEGPPPVKTSAAELGAGHIRERIFILARDASAGWDVRADSGGEQPRQEQRRGEYRAEPVRDREVVGTRADHVHADADGGRGATNAVEQQAMGRDEHGQPLAASGWPTPANPERDGGGEATNVGCSDAQAHAERLDHARVGGEASADGDGLRQRPGVLHLRPWEPDAAGRDWWAAEPGLVRLVHGAAHRVDRVRLAGNIATPQQTVLAWRLLNAAMESIS